MEPVAPRTIEGIVSANLIWGGVPVCDVCAHEWKCPNPDVHELSGCCPDCENWSDILQEHMEECAQRCIARWQVASRQAGRVGPVRMKKTRT